MQFTAFNPVIKFLRSDKSYRLELDVAASDYPALAALGSPTLQGQLLQVTIAQDVEPNEAADHAELQRLEKLAEKIAAIRDRFRKLRGQYCDEFGLTLDEFKAKYQQGKSYKDIPLDELEKMSENLVTSLKTNTP